MKIVRLTEGDLKDIVGGVLSKIYRKMPLYEYAMKRDFFVDHIGNLLPQIFENWCLVRYCSTVGRTYLKEHWRNELKGYLDTIFDMELKGNNSPIGRIKCVKEAFDDRDWYKNGKILKRISNKFSKERIDINSKEVASVVEECYNSLDEMARVIGTYGIDPSCEEYVNNL